jgi:hypothetical protein
MRNRMISMHGRQVSSINRPLQPRTPGLRCSACASGCALRWLAAGSLVIVEKVRGHNLKSRPARPVGRQFPFAERRSVLGTRHETPARELLSVDGQAVQQYWPTVDVSLE